MGKALATAAIIVGAVALAATGAGAIAGLAASGTLLGVSAATFTTIGALAGVASAALSAAGGIGAKPVTAAATGSQTEFRADPEALIPVVIGRLPRHGRVCFRGSG